ncbi:MAG: hypothetical protein VYA53_05285 [Acidobacteriota bacterium]|nr:hypothetical protein [Acidobacteriota bacterium]
MNCTVWVKSVFILVLLWVPMRPSLGQGTYNQMESLQGIESLRVLVEPDTRDAHKIGLTELQIKTDVELQLQQANITVVDGTPGEVPTLYVLYVNLTVLSLENIIPDDTDPGVTVSIEIELRQPATLVRDPSIVTFSAITWTQSLLGISSLEMAHTAIREQIRNQVDIFLNDYRTANPIAPS